MNQKKCRKKDKSLIYTTAKLVPINNILLGLLVSGIYKCKFVVELMCGTCVEVQIHHLCLQMSLFGGIGRRLSLSGGHLWLMALCMCHVID